MHQGCVRSQPTKAGGAAGWWPTSPSCRWAGRSTTPANWPPTTNSICPATVSPRAAGTAPAPLRSACRAKHRRRASGACSRAGTPRPGSCWGAPMAATPCPALTWCCGRPRASRSFMAWVTRPPAGRSWPPTTPGWPRRSATWTDTWGPAVAMVVSGQGVLAVGFDHRTSREGDPLLHTHLLVANRVQGPDGRWTALDGRDLYRHRLAADAIYRATYQHELVRTLGGGVDAGGRPRQPRAPRHAR
jgi:hypothetical protein